MKFIKNNSNQQSIYIFFDCYYRKEASTGKLLREIATALSSEFSITVITSKNKDLVHLPDNIDYKVFGVKSEIFPRSSLLLRLINDFLFSIYTLYFITFFVKKADSILVVSNPAILPFFSAVAAKVKSVPLIFLVHDIYPKIAAVTGLIRKNSLLFQVFDIMNALTYQIANKIVVLGRCMKEELVENNVPESKIRVIQNWSDSKKVLKIEISQNTLLQEMSYLKQKFTVLYSGNLGRFQDFETILLAAKELQKHENIQFVIAGQGVKKQWIQNEIEKLELKNVHLLPFLHEERFLDLLSITDLGLITLELGAEGLGVPSKLYALIASGISIGAIMGDKSEISRLLSEYSFGFRVTQGNSMKLASDILELYSNENLQKQYQENAQRLFSERFDKHIAMNLYKNLFLEVLKHDNNNNSYV